MGVTSLSHSLEEEKKSRNIQNFLLVDCFLFKYRRKMYKIIVVLASLFAVIHSNPNRSSNSFYKLLTDNPLSITKVLKNYNSRPVHRSSFSSKHSGNGNKVYTTRRRTYHKKKPARTQYYTVFPDSHRSAYTTKNEIIRPKSIFKPITTPVTTPAPTTTPTTTPTPKPAPTPA